MDKFNNAVKSYGGVVSKRIFFTDVPMKLAVAKKCDQAGILYFSMMTLEGDEEKQKNFFKLLDQEMQEINK
ncbi:MAG: hypothetical protein LKF48_02265 [Prevotella sp.]|nr:hypothetical protein [Prevotella sp.]MCH4181975.1 hypothetical protein [Prevotella sp.]MCH4212275.1 hypothetical protein [Prevotella sp.]MCH4242090.1 hypothetical protein [Prevotella sp.]